MAIGLYHLAAGNEAIPGAEDAGATVDSFGRFMGAILVGYGLAWLWTVRQSPIPAVAVRLLAGVFLLGGLSRLLSIAVEGRPHGFQLLLMTIELALSPVYFWLADARRNGRCERGSEPFRRLGGTAERLGLRSRQRM